MLKKESNIFFWNLAFNPNRRPCICAVATKADSESNTVLGTLLPTPTGARESALSSQSCFKMLLLAYSFSHQFSTTFFGLSIYLHVTCCWGWWESVDNSSFSGLAMPRNASRTNSKSQKWFKEQVMRGGGPIFYITWGNSIHLR